MAWRIYKVELDSKSTNYEKVAYTVKEFDYEHAIKLCLRQTLSMWFYLQDPPTFQHITWKTRNEPENEAAAIADADTYMHD